MERFSAGRSETAVPRTGIPFGSCNCKLTASHYFDNPFKILIHSDNVKVPRSFVAQLDAQT